MRRLLNGSLGIALFLAGCQAGAPTRTAPSPSPGPGSSPPAARATRAPTPPVAARPAGTEPLKLDAPAAGTARLAGQVRLDAGYALRAGAGASLIGLDGSTLTGGGAGATLIGMDGSTLRDGQLLDRAGRVVAAEGSRFAVPAGLIGLDGSTLIGNDGSTLVGNDGSTLMTGGNNGTLIGNDGSTLIGNDGSTLVAAGGGNYALLQAGAGGAAVPAAGMWVSVVDTRTGFTVALGTSAGKPVYTLYTDARGGFEAHVPADVAPFARVVARAPGKPDAGLVVNLLARTAPAGADLVVDAEAASATTFFRTIFGIRVAGALTVDPKLAAQAFGGRGGDGGVRAALDGLLAAIAEPALLEIQAAYRAIPADALSAAKRHELHLVMADRVFADLDLGELKLTNALMGTRKGAAELEGRPVLAELHTVFRHIREGARAQLVGQADPVAYFAAKPYMQEYNLRQDPADRVRIAQAEDLVAFVVRAYLAENDAHVYEKYHDVLHDLYPDLPVTEREGLDPQALELRDRDRLSMAGGAFTQAFAQKLFEAAGERERSVATLTSDLIRQVGARLKAAPDPVPPLALPPPPVPAPPPAEPEWIVTTVAGKAGDPDVTDGPGADARFKQPRGLWVDPVADPPIVYVADAGNGLIRKLAFDAAGAATVSTVAGVKLLDRTGKLIGARLAQDGPPNVGCFVEPSDLAFAPDGKLYVVDAGMHALRRVNFDKGAADADVETLAGALPTPQDPPLADGPGAEVRFKYPIGLLLEADGHALLMDSLHNAVRRIGLAAPFPVTTFVGSTAPGELDGPLRKADGSPGARLGQAFDAARAPDGSVWLTEGSAIRRIDPDGRAIATIAGGSVPQREALDQPAYGRSATFDAPWSIAMAASGDAIVADFGNHRIRRVRPDGWVTTIAGGGAVGLQAGGWADGAGPAARFKFPRGVAVAPDGSIFVADDSHTIRRIRRP